MRFVVAIVFILFNFLSHAKENTIVVAKDGSGHFTTIQEAVDSVRAFTPQPFKIFIKNGIYKEKLLIPTWKTNLTLVGEDIEKTIISYDDYSGKDGINTFNSYTFLVQGNDITIENLTIENTAGPVGQAVALHVEGDRFIIRNCRILGNQDTLYTGRAYSRQLYDNCYIEGTTDFIFGPSTAVFNNCTLHSKKNSYITAASTPQQADYGYIFINCIITADPDITEVYLGRPWRDYAKTVFINCEMGNHIRPEGWHNWNRPEAEKTTIYAEYNSKGPGGEVSQRVSWSKQLKPKELAKYTVENVLKGCDNWHPTLKGGIEQ